MVFIYKNNELCERMSLSEALSVNTSVISVVGAGGKTTLLHRLEDECVRKKQHVIITTTTKIMHENKPYFLEDTSIGKIKDTLGKFGRVWIGSRDLISGKTAPPAKEILDEIFWWELPILVEADGAKRLPLKVPAEHEPVIPSQTGHVVSVFADSIDRGMASGSVLWCGRRWIPECQNQTYRACSSGLHIRQDYLAGYI